MDPLLEKRNGYSLEDCAEIMNRMTELKTEHGEPGFKPHWQQFLRSKGLTENSWANVWNEWHQVTEADPQLGAKFHMFMSQARLRQMTAKQPNVAGEAMEGLSLETYAKISAQIQTGAAVEGLIAGEGLTMEQWQAGQAAWAQRMGNCSPTDPVMLQYGQLYQKWSPNHQAAMEAATATFLRDAAEQGGRGGGMSQTLDMDNAPEFFEHEDIRVRARGVREMVRIWDLNWNDRDERMRGLTQRAYDEAIRILTEGAGTPGLTAVDRPVDQLDIHTWSELLEQEQTQQGTADLVVSPLKDLAAQKFMTPQQNEAAQNALRQAMARLQPRVQAVDAAWSNVTDELKRVQVRQLKDDYRELIGDLQEALGDWEYEDPAEVSQRVVAQPTAAAQRMLAQRHQPPQSGLMFVLKRIPILGSILRMLGL